MDSRLFLIDGHALVFKMYYAFARRPMINSKGADMSILFGFTKYILELIEREKPTHLAVSFDPPGGTFRNVMYPEYKANRAETPQLVIDALEPLTELCHALNIPVLMEMGFEADDVVGTVAKTFASEHVKVFMVTPDKDYGQLIDANIVQLKPGKAGDPDILVDSKAVCEKYGISDPLQVIEMLTLCGDSADNVPGVKGVGEVGAGKLIAKYGSVENIYQHLDELSERQRNMFEEARGHIALSHELVTIKTDVPVKVTMDQMALDTAYPPLVADLFEKYEFNSLRKYIGNVKPTEPQTVEVGIAQVSPAELVRMAGKTGLASIVVDAEKDHGTFCAVRGVTAAVVVAESSVVVAKGSAEEFRVLLEDSAVGKCGYDLKRQYNVLKYNGIALGGKLDDISLMHYLTSPEKSHELDVLAKSFLSMDVNPADEESEVSLFETAEVSHDREAAAMVLLDSRMRDEMKATMVTTLYDEMEEPLIRVLARMEYDGVKVDLQQLSSFADHLRQEVSEREARIREMADEPALNISSPKQIGVLLFEKLQLDPKAKKSAKGSWTTDEETLNALSDRHPIVNEILEFRAVKKLLSTYIEPFPGYVSPVSGKIHTTFNQALTATGRLSSSNPNLQNIPIRSERGKEIRKAFVPSMEDGLILSADYSQIELRIMAHLCGDTHLIESFKAGVDVHAATAAKIFGIPVEEVTSDQRRIAKTANFGIMYGISSFGLSQRLGVSRTEAKKIIDDYFEAFPSIKTFIAQTIATTQEKGYVETIFGRRRYLPEINAKNGTVRALAERNAVNAPIQGTSADIIKLAMIGVGRRLEEEGLKSRMVLQIHDELLFDTCEAEAERLKAIVVEEMENVISLSIPLTVECGYGKNWLEAH
ncbi:MAG: DNA polymerase I [Bacteroidales bacterium]|nr:DNA polymerase I [Bacteroidales bacterium]